jgi:proteasome accessory factor B
LADLEAFDDEGEWSLEGDDKAERLLSLTLTLLSNQRGGVTKEELMGLIRGYRHAVSKAKNSDAVNKLFERDKASLRELGIQVETFIRPSDMDDNTETRYRISSATFNWPKGTKLSANQLRLLELAAKVWARASFSIDAQRAVTRLKALGMPSDGLDLSGFAPRIMTTEPSFVQLDEAIRDGLEVSFFYRAPDSEIAKRTVQPLQLRNVSGQWLLVSRDLDRNLEIRHFMLKRIVSRIDETGNRFTKATLEEVEDAKQQLDKFIEKNVAVIKVVPNTEAWVHFDLDAPGALQDGLYSFHFMDLHLLAEELRQYGKSVTVMQPEALQQAVRRGFEKVASLHA